MRPALSLILFLPLVSAVTFNIPENLTSGGPATITWTPDNGDPDTISLELANPRLFHDAIAIANNVAVGSKQVTVTLPIVPPANDYTVVAVQVNNINQVYGTSGAFTIGATVTSTSSSTASSLSSTLASSASVTNPAGSTSGASVTVSSTRSSSGSPSSASPSSFNGNGALGNYIGSGAVNSIAAAVVGIVAGVVFV